MISKLAQRRLSALIRFMDSLSPKAAKHFNMRWWVMHNGAPESVFGEHGISTGGEVTKTTLIECGMAACAFGWAATVPSFKKAGLRLTRKTSARGLEYLAPTYRGHCDSEAAKTFFDLSEEKSDELFAPFVRVESPKQWSRLAKRKLQKWARAA